MFLAVLMVAVMLGGSLEASQAEPLPPVIEVSKTINVPSVVPGQVPVPLYTVTFTNPKTTEVILDRITDTLPSGFEFSGMASASDWITEPTDTQEPEIVWTGPITLPASDKLSFVYMVYVKPTVPPRITPYVNTVRAVAHDGTPVETASARLVVGAAHLSVTKQAAPNRVLTGGLVTYTVVFSNSGQLTGTVELITDTLDPDLTFEAMVAGSDVMTAPLPSGDALVWYGPFQVAPLEMLTLKYRVRTSSEPGWSSPSNEVEAKAGQETLTAEKTILVGPEKSYAYLPLVFKNFAYAWLSVQKTAFPTKVSTLAGQVVTYTVTIRNGGDTTGILKTINDTLPAGFAFHSMAPGSDPSTPPVVNGNKLIWSGTWNMAPDQQRRLIYRVTPSQTEGQYTNSVDVTAQQAFVPVQPAVATVTVEKGVLLEDHFENGMDRWTRFTNYWRVKDPDQWYWEMGDGVGDSGAVTQDCYVGTKVAEDALLMYLGEGAEQWTDYRVEAKMLLRGGCGEGGEFLANGGHPIGLWVRGQYEDSTITAQKVTGYYIVAGGGLGGDYHYVRLGQMQTLTDCWDQACNNPENLYTFNNIHTLVEAKNLDGEFSRWEWHTLVVEVRGARIQVWFDGEAVIDYTDNKEPFLTGTVGFKTYKSQTASFDDIIVTPLNP